MDEFDCLLSHLEVENGTVALQLAERGFAVFPIRDWGDGDRWKPIKDFPGRASADRSTVQAWWRDWPDAQVGLLADSRNGISVLDIDKKNGKDGVATLRELGFPDLVALSPSRTRTKSGGWHLFFKHDPRLKNSASEIGVGLDVKTRRAYVIAPGSVVDGRRYFPSGAPLGSVDLPAFPEALIPPTEPERDAPDIVAEPTAEQRDFAADRLALLAAELADVGEGSRNDTLNSAAMWAGGAAAHGFLERDAVESVLWLAAERAGIGKREFRDTFKSGWKAGLAKPLSDFPRSHSANEFDNLDDKPGGSDFDDDKPPAPRLRFLAPSDCAAAPSRGYVVKGLLAAGDVACIYGAPGAGKSLIAPHIGYRVARGESAFGMRTKPGVVFYVAAEDPHGMRGRVSALKIRDGDAPEFALVEGVSDLLAKDSPDLKALRTAIAERKPSLVFLDTLAMSFPGLEENSSEEMGRVVRIARKLAEHGAAVVLIHHDTKAQSPTPRGHSLLNGALDIALQLFPKDEFGVVRGKLSKNRNGTCDRDFAFTIDTRELGTDEDGDPISVALVNELSGTASTRRAKLSASELAALKLLKDGRHPLRLDMGEDDWRAACIESRSVSASDDRESRRKATKRAFEGLLRKGVVEIRDGVATVAGRLATDEREAGFEDPFV